MVMPQNEQEFELVILEYLINKRKREISRISGENIHKLKDEIVLPARDEDGLGFIPIYKDMGAGVNMPVYKEKAKQKGDEMPFGFKEMVSPYGYTVPNPPSGDMPKDAGMNMHNIKKNINFPPPLSYGKEKSFMKDIDYVKNMMGYILKEIYPHVITTLNAYDYYGSPVYEHELHKSLVQQITEQALQLIILSVKSLNLADDNMNKKLEDGYWTPMELLLSAVEGLVIFHIFGVMRASEKKEEKPQGDENIGFEFSTSYY